MIGGPQSRSTSICLEKVAESMSAMLAWASAPSVDLRSASRTSGLGRAHYFLLLLILTALVVRYNDALRRYSQGI